MITPVGDRPNKRKRRADEDKIQSESWCWLWNEHPETRGLFFACINETTPRNMSRKDQEILGSMRKMRGIVAGVSDSIGLIPRGRFHGVCAEAKTPTGVQSEAQKLFQNRVEEQGYYYFIYRTVEEFKSKMEWYLNK